MDTFKVICGECGCPHKTLEWELARVMIEEEDGHSSYRYVYLSTIYCGCGNDVVVEAQGYQPYYMEIVEKWFYRFFNCEQATCFPAESFS